MTMYYCISLLIFTLVQRSYAGTVVESSKLRVSYHGALVGSTEHFQNIRFAQDTSGVLRFAPPVPFIPPAGTEIDATAAGAACPQTRDAMPPFFVETKEMSEDCLNLRIARPQGTRQGDKLPVVVWLHGGGVVKGSAYDPHFDPDKIITLSHELKTPVIYVALNYRLTIFGFARTPLLKERLSLNVGMRDQRAGLQWVKDHIQDFGGDGDRITVSGLSSGGTFASLHLMAFGGDQGVPFNQIWAMSGPSGTALNMTSIETEHHTYKVAAKFGCSQGEDTEILQCLRNVPMPKLLDVALEHSVQNHPPAGLFTFIPSVDDDMYTARPSELYKAGRFVKDIPMVLGWTQDDGAMNAGPAHLIQDEDAMKSAVRGFAASLDDQDLDTLFSLYPIEDFSSRAEQYEVPVHYFRLSQILRDLLFTCSSIELGHEMSKQSQWSGMEDSNVRLYALNQSMLTPLWHGAGMPYVSVSHGSDTNYIFNGVFPEGQISQSDQELSRVMAEAFIRFASTGNPNHAASRRDDFWPKTFSSPTGDELLRSFHLQIIGGPLGTGAGIVTSTAAAAGENIAWDPNMVDGAQQVLQGYDLGSMTSGSSLERAQVIAREKLIERCSFINSLSEKLGV